MKKRKENLKFGDIIGTRKSKKAIQDKVSKYSRSKTVLSKQKNNWSRPSSRSGSEREEGKNDYRHYSSSDFENNQ